MIIVELKQWTQAGKTPLHAVVTTQFKHGSKEVSRPSCHAWSFACQARSYAALLENFNEAVEDHQIRLSPCACLHNYSDPDVDLLDPFCAEHLKRPRSS